MYSNDGGGGVKSQFECTVKTSIVPVTQGHKAVLVDIDRASREFFARDENEPQAKEGILIAQVTDPRC